KALGIS
nr:Chain A, LYS-ALA-LEU-GLY-ILE-SER [Homo sapiens]6C3G_B Chain B, LYS-ALA-LEU-GLY-ILE-SER [Homo sapiens]